MKHGHPKKIKIYGLINRKRRESMREKIEKRLQAIKKFTVRSRFMEERKSVKNGNLVDTFLITVEDVERANKQVMLGGVDTLEEIYARNEILVGNEVVNLMPLITEEIINAAYRKSLKPK